MITALRPESIVYIVISATDDTASIFDAEPVYRDEPPILLAGPMSIEEAEQIAATMVCTEGTA